MTADSDNPGSATDVDRRTEALLAALEALLKLEEACKEDYGGRDDSDGLGLFIDAKYTAIWLASAIPQLREFLAANPILDGDPAKAILGKLNSLRNEETPDYGWHHVVRIVAETFGLDEEARATWVPKPRTP